MDFKTLSTVKLIDLKIPGLKIISKIGEGGMSVVYLAEQISLKREIAVKVMKLDVANNELDVQRFKHEAKTIAHLDHPNIINIYNIGQTSKGEIFFTMPYLNHGDLSNYILEDEQEFITLLKSICDGLAFAHDRGIIHRDIKPENLLFDKFGNVRIADFGIAVSKDGTRMTKEHQIVGSAQYMSPEQARSLKVDVHTDIYSLGIVIYERLTGRVPFDSDESISVLVNHVSTEPPKLQAKMRHWQPLIDKCLAKSPGERYQSMTELKIALNRMPVNSLQRTNSTIQKILTDETGRHLKWFVPSLLVLLLVAFAAFNKDNKEELTEQPIAIETVEVNKAKNEVVVLPDNSVGTVITDKKEEILKQKSKAMPEIVEQESKAIPEILKQESKVIPEIVEQNIEKDNITQSGFEGNVDSSGPLEEDINIIEAVLDKDIEQLLKEGFENIENYQLSKPVNNNATDQLLQVLALNPENTEAIRGIKLIGGKYNGLIIKSINDYDFNVALKHSRSQRIFNQKTNNSDPNIAVHKESIITIIRKIDLTQESISAEQVRTLSRIVRIFSPKDELLPILNQQASSKLGPQKGDKLMDEMGIETILVTGTLAYSINEITVEYYSEFANETNRSASKCKHKGGGINNLFSTKTWKKPYFKQTLDHPVVCVSYDDATAYARWLSNKTENNYRVPTKVEWLSIAALEHNNFEACKTANVSGQEALKLKNKEDKYGCDDKFKNTAPVASFNQNELSLFDVQGNVSEWVSCKKTPCTTPEAMGSSWYSGQQSNTFDKSETFKPSTGYTYVGFRLVRDL